MKLRSLAVIVATGLIALSTAVCAQPAANGAPANSATGVATVDVQGGQIRVVTIDDSGRLRATRANPDGG